MNGATDCPGDTVAQDMFALLRQVGAPVLTRWTYCAADPFAISLSIMTRREAWIEWDLARDLLVAGLTGPVGIGDVRVRPERVEDHDAVLVELHSPAGSALLELDQELLRRFVDASLAAVPLGQESAATDLDAEIEKITRSCAG